MEALKYFFRGTPDGNYFRAFTLPHFILIGLTVFGAYYILKNREKIKQSESGKKGWKICLASLILIQQAILYGWYMFSGYFTISESLPFYTCRVAMLFTAFGLLTGNKLMKSVGCYWGILGSIVAIIMVNADPFGFPHYTVVSYFLGHIVLLWANLYIIAVEGFRFNMDNFKTVMIFTNIYNIFIYIFDVLTNSNYCYMVYSPFGKEFLQQHVSNGFYSLCMYLIFDLIMILVYLGFSSKKFNTYMDGVKENI